MSSLFLKFINILQKSIESWKKNHLFCTGKNTDCTGKRRYAFSFFNRKIQSRTKKSCSEFNSAKCVCWTTQLENFLLDCFFFVFNIFACVNNIAYKVNFFLFVWKRMHIKGSFKKLCYIKRWLKTSASLMSFFPSKLKRYNFIEFHCW